MRFRCKIGIHKFEFREVHVLEKLMNKKQFLTCIIEKCRCGKSRFQPLYGGAKLTSVIVSKNLSKEENYG